MKRYIKSTESPVDWISIELQDVRAGDILLVDNIPSSVISTDTHNTSIGLNTTIICEDGFEYTADCNQYVDIIR